MTCEEFEELSGAYALGAITQEERKAAQEHLATCAKCRQRLSELQAVVNLLPLSVTQISPSPAVKGSLLEAIRQERNLITADQLERQREQRERNRHKRVSAWMTRLATAAAIFFLLLSVAMTAWNVSLQHSVSSLSQQNTTLSGQISDLQRQNVSLKGQIAMAYTVVGNSTTQNISGEFIYIPNQHISVLVLHGLPQLSGTQVYQGWLLRGGKPTSIGLLTVQNGIASVTYPGDIGGYEVAAVSREPGPSASRNAPAGPVIATGKLSHAATFYIS
ncbi:MAG TPA: anti-sigma factor [Ktedonobacteraceae bacterium]|jgi:anti-sigma-K factor RskA|nr:anti-sigma factor [Ktedonobacteraceae bacterium]